MSYSHFVARLLGIDIGTSGCRAIVIDETGRVIAQAFEKYPISMPHPTWSEQDPADWWRATQECLRSLARESGNTSPATTLRGRSVSEVNGEGVTGKTTEFAPPPPPSSAPPPQSSWAAGEEFQKALTAISLTGQMHGAVFLDEDNNVIRPAILWNDQRTTEECEDIDRIVGAERVRAITCNPPLTGFQLPKILWLRKHEPKNFARVRKVLLPKDYIRFLLTGEFITEMSDASGTGIFDVRSRRWSREMMALLDLDPSIFPPCVESVAPTGFAVLSDVTQSRKDSQSRKDAANDRVIRSSDHAITQSSVPVFGGGGDQAMGAVGTGAVVPGIVSISLGTSGVVFQSMDAIEAMGTIRDSRSAMRDAFHTFCHANGAWHVMGVMLACGGALSWYAAQVRHMAVEDVLEEAATAEPGCGGLTFLPYLSGERSPINDPLARAGFVGLNLSLSTKEMSRAVVEGVTFGMRNCFEALQGVQQETPPSRSLRSRTSPASLRVAGEEFAVRVTGGGARSDFWVQMIADVLGVPCETLEADEGPAFGAALIAGVGAGVWPSLEEACAATIRTSKRFEPSQIDYEDAYRRYKGLYPQLKGWFANF